MFFRFLKFAVFIFFLTVAFYFVLQKEPSEFALCRGSEVLLLPHHLLVESLIEEMYRNMDLGEREVIIVSPNHFNQGTRTVLPANELELGFTVHRDMALKLLNGKNGVFSSKNIEGWMLKEDVSEAELDRLADELLRKNALFIFSVDFSHYLPGRIAYVHDLLAQDVITSRSYPDVAKLEIDSTASIRLLLKLLERRELIMNIVRNTNPSLDADIVTTENTTHMFGCSRNGTPLPRQLSTTMYFQRDREWYVGKSKEDRYLKGYDAVFFGQDVPADTAVIEWGDGREERYEYVIPDSTHGAKRSASSLQSDDKAISRCDPSTASDQESLYSKFR